MKFLLDECVPGKTKKLLTKLGFSVVTVADLDRCSAKDPEVFHLAQSRKAILLTTDMNFANVIAYPVGSHAGIVVLRLRPDKPGAVNEVHAVLERLLKELKTSLIERSLVIVDRDKYRIKRE